MDKAKRARTAETPKQPSLGLKLRAPYLYPDRWLEIPARLNKGMLRRCEIRGARARNSAPAVMRVNLVVLKSEADTSLQPLPLHEPAFTIPLRGGRRQRDLRAVIAGLALWGCHCAGGQSCAA